MLVSQLDSFEQDLVSLSDRIDALMRLSSLSLPELEACIDEALVASEQLPIGEELSPLFYLYRGVTREKQGKIEAAFADVKKSADLNCSAALAYLKQFTDLHGQIDYSWFRFGQVDEEEKELMAALNQTDWEKALCRLEEKPTSFTLHLPDEEPLDERETATILNGIETKLKKAYEMLRYP
jgi:hypothetical protein